MAKKEEKKGAAAQPAATNEENVMEIIRKGNLIDEEVIKLGDEKDSEAEMERKVREYREAKNKSKYINLKALLELRKRRREEKTTKAWLTKTKEFFDDLCTGKITPREYDEKRTEAAKERQKAFSESENQYDKELRELKDQFPGYWCYDWDY